jgi:hypothetical protein
VQNGFLHKTWCLKNHGILLYDTTKISLILLRLAIRKGLPCHLPRQIPYRLHREKKANVSVSRVCCYASWQCIYAVPAYNSKRRPDSLGSQAGTSRNGMRGWLNPQRLHGLNSHTDIVA